MKIKIQIALYSIMIGISVGAAFTFYTVRADVLKVRQENNVLLASLYEEKQDNMKMKYNYVQLSEMTTDAIYDHLVKLGFSKTAANKTSSYTTFFLYSKKIIRDFIDDSVSKQNVSKQNVSKQNVSI